MTDESERELTPEEDARIRSLLAAARADSTVPDDVASRLDSVLAELIDSRRAAAPRRRNAGKWLLGVAAASVAAIAVFNLPNSVPGGTSDSAGSATTSGEAKRAPQAGAAAPTATVRLHSATFRRDVSRLLSTASSRYQVSGAPVPATGASPSPSGGSSSGSLDAVRGQACAPSSQLPGGVQSRAVLLDGKRALLEVFAVTGGSRVVRVVSCDGVETLATARIPAP